jgi:hypothetical protein
MLGCERADSLLSIRYSAAPPISVDMVSVTVDDGDRTWTWSGADFRTSMQNSSAPTTPERGTRSSGVVRLTVRITDGATVVAAGDAQLDLRPDWRWSVDILSATADPTLNCFGCLGSASFPLHASYRKPGRDSLWLVWGGNSIENPVVY